MTICTCFCLSTPSLPSWMVSGASREMWGGRGVEPAGRCGELGKWSCGPAFLKFPHSCEVIVDCTALWGLDQKCGIIRHLIHGQCVYVLEGALFGLGMCISSHSYQSSF